MSNLGTQLTVTAVGLQVYGLTGSTFSVGLLGIFALVPLVGLGLYGGALVDAFDRRKVALYSALGLWAVVIVLVVQAVLRLDSVWLLYGLVGFQSAGFAVNNPARTAIVPRLVEPRRLPAANVLLTVGGYIALTVGPLLAAAFVAGPGFAAAYAVDAVLFTAALWALWRLPDLPPATSDRRTRRLGLGAVADGLRYLGTRPNVRMTFVVDLIAMALWVPLAVAATLLALAGGADAVSSVFRQTILQSATPDDMRGRLQGVFIVVVAGGPLLGDLVLGSAAGWTSEGWAALAGGLVCVLLLGAVTVRQRGLWAYDARHPVP